MDGNRNACERPGRPSTISGWVFRVAVAVTAAAVMDPIVERMSEAGLFGPGRFTDRSNIDVIPALCVALAFSLLFVILLARRMLATRVSPPQWLQRCAQDVESSSTWRLMPAIFAIQMSVLFSMETLEQIAVAGHPLGGTVWLGGPIAIGFVLHAIACVAATLTLSHALNRFARTIVYAVRFALEYFRKQFEECTPPRLSIWYFASPKFIEPYLRSLQGRAPPTLAIR